jgi:CheY-like chemotaxis protein
MMGFHIFVVDDEEVIAATVVAILQMSGFAATSFTDPLQALSRARIESPDLLISDVTMPEMSGVDLAIQIREDCPGCKVLLFSGQAATLDLLGNARDLGHDFRLLLKPVHPADLLCEIRSKLKPPLAPVEGLRALPV